MTERDFWVLLAKVTWDHDQGEEFEAVISQMINLLDAGDHEDFFGTEGWRHRFGWD